MKKKFYINVCVLFVIGVVDDVCVCVCLYYNCSLVRMGFYMIKDNMYEVVIFY